MGSRIPSIENVKVTTSLTFKGKVAPKGQVFYIAKAKEVVGEGKIKVWTLHQLALRTGATKNDELLFMDAMKKKLIQDIQKNVN